MENKKHFCPNCGTELKEAAAFCLNCGYRFNKQPQKKQESQKKDSVHSDEKKKDKPVSDKKAEPIEKNGASAEKPKSSTSHPKVQIFCPNCGHPLKQGATFCNNCGYNLVTKQMPKSQPQATRQQVATPQVTQKVRKPMKPLTKVLLSLLGVLVVAFIAFYAWGTQHYSKNNQIEWITSSLRDPNKGMAQYITADTPSMKVTDDTVRPLQNHYKDHQTAVTKMAQKLKEDIDPNDQISLVKNGHYLLIFPKYQLQVKTFQPQVETNHGNSEVSMNGKNIGKLSSDDGKYAKKLQLVFPGKYHFTVKSQVAGRTLTATSTTNIWANKTLNMDIKTQTFSVKSVPNGEVYINDKKVGTLDKDGEITFKSYPITRNMELYVLYNGVKSEPVTDMADSFGDFTDESDDDDDYTDDASDDGSADVTQQNGSYVVQPKWKGLIAKDDAESLLDDNFHDPDDDAFVNGSDNKWYGQIKQQNDRWDKDDSMDSYDTEASVESVYPAKSNQSKVNYRVTYTFEYDDHTKKEIVEYTGAVLQKDGDKYIIKTIGDGKLISSHDEDN